MTYKVNAYGIEIICDTAKEVTEIIRCLKNWPQRTAIETVEGSIPEPLKIELEKANDEAVDRN